MKRLSFLVTLAVLIALALAGATPVIAYAADIELEPTSGVSVVTVNCTDFNPYLRVTFPASDHLKFRSQLSISLNLNFRCLPTL